MAAFHESNTQAFIVVGSLLLYQQFEDRFLVPRIYGQTLNLPPLVVLIAVLAGGQLLGITGVLVALPAAAAGRVGLEYWLEKLNPAAANLLPSSDPVAPDSIQTGEEQEAGQAASAESTVVSEEDMPSRGVGKCENNHVGSYGYPGRPEEPYQFCAQCGSAMMWACPSCSTPLPYDGDEFLLRSFAATAARYISKLHNLRGRQKLSLAAVNDVDGQARRSIIARPAVTFDD